MLPNRLVVRAYAVRGFTLWLLTRLLISGVMLSAGGNPLAVSPVVILYIVLICAGVNVAEVKRRHELALLGNLGVSYVQLAVFFTVPAIAGEMVLRLITLPFR